MFKKKCPICGAKNDKERMVCIQCGRPFASAQGEGRLAQISIEAEAQVKEVSEKFTTRDLIQKKKSSLEKTALREKTKQEAQHTSQRKSIWFWVGVVLLSISALWWLLLISVNGDISDTVLTGLVTTIVPIGIGVYCVMRGRKAPAAEMQQSTEPTYTSQTVVPPTRETQRAPDPTAKLTQETRWVPEPAYPTQRAAKPAQRTPLGFFGTLKEKLRDKTRDKLCASLCAIDLDASMVERGRLEEYITWHGEKSTGLIEIRDSPIRWVNVVGKQRSAGQVYINVYLVLAFSVPTEGYLELESVRGVKTVPLFGPVVDLRWKAKIKWKFMPILSRKSVPVKTESSIIRRLSEDVSLKQKLIGLKEDIKIRSFPEQKCWAMLSSHFPSGCFRSSMRQPAPSRELWDCYETIARHLLAE